MALEHESRIRRLAPGYVVLYAYVFTIVAFDGIMALQPHWYSNLLGGFYFMGSFLGAHMLLALLALYGSAHLGIQDLVSPKQRHDLGKLCFGFTVFWTYLMWAQFLVIWYGNLPEETGFVFARLWGHWLPVGQAVIWGMFLIPFFGLLGVAPKKVRATLGFFATHQPDRALAGALPPGDAVGHRLTGPPFRGCRSRADPGIHGTLPAVVRALRPHLPNGLTPSGGDHPQRGAGPHDGCLRIRS